MSGNSYLSELRQELQEVRENSHASRLLKLEIQKTEMPNTSQSTHNISETNREDDLVILSEKVYIPKKEYPNCNFVGKILGPGGSTLKQLQQETMTRMSIFGRGSMRDKDKEEELRKSGGEKYLHLSEDLHICISVKAFKTDAHERLAKGLRAVKFYLDPKNLEIHDRELKDMALSAACGYMKQPVLPPVLPPRRPREDNDFPPRRSAQDYEKYLSTYNPSYEGYPDTGRRDSYEDRNQAVQYPNVGQGENSYDRKRENGDLYYADSKSRRTDY